MRTRSQSRRRRQQQTLPVVVENFDLEEPIVDQNIVAMADNRTMAQMLQAPIEGYEDAIGQQGPAGGPAQPELPEEAGSSS
ncbi:hypothetical protein Tco_0931704 [Tanacetum coccineum]